MKLKWTKPHPAPAAAAAPARPPDPEPVQFVECLGDERVRWSVVEMDARAVPGARRARCLVFSHARSVRRVWDYPEGWRTLDDAALTALSRGR